MKADMEFILKCCSDKLKSGRLALLVAQWKNKNLLVHIIEFMKIDHNEAVFVTSIILDTKHGLRTPNERINQRNPKFWADVAYKICYGRTYKFGIGIWFLTVQWGQFAHQASVVRTVNIYRYKAIGANATSSVILYTGKCISPCLEIL